MNIILFDYPEVRTNLLPFTYTRPVADIRCGILTIGEKWERWLPADYSWLTEDYLSGKFPQQRTEENLYLNGSIFPGTHLTEALKALKPNQLLVKDDFPIAFYGDVDSYEALDLSNRLPLYDKLPFSHELMAIRQPYDIFVHNGVAVRSDFKMITKDRKSADISDRHTVVYGSENIFVEEGATIKAAVLNAEDGVIYIGRNARIGENAVVRSGAGGTAICENATLSIGTKINGDTTVGPFGKVGGEVSNAVIFGYSNKAHDGFLGNSVVGEWCNFGADTNTSNLTNNYKNIRLWNYGTERFLDTGLQFCGLMMGDHSKCGINTMFNAGTVVGVNANIHGSGYPRNFIPSFSNGGAHGFVTYPIKQALKTADIVYKRRNKSLTDEDAAILKYIFEVTKIYRPA